MMMRKYKITNLTNELNKRDVNYNKLITFDYVDGMERKYINLSGGEVVYFITKDKLPMSVLKYKMKGFISVNEVPINNNVSPSRNKTNKVDNDKDKKKKVDKVSTSKNKSESKSKSKNNTSSTTNKTDKSKRSSTTSKSEIKSNDDESDS